MKRCMLCMYYDKCDKKKCRSEEFVKRFIKIGVEKGKRRVKK